MNRKSVALLSILGVLVSMVIVLGGFMTSRYKPPSPVQGVPSREERDRISSRPPEWNVSISASLAKDLKERTRHLEDVCQKLDMSMASKPRYEDIPASDLKNIIVDDKYKVMYCSIPKVACTTMTRIFLILKGKLNVTEALKIQNVHADYKPALSFLHMYSQREIRYRLQAYTKAVIVREPLERIMSAYKNKLEGTIDNETNRRMVKNYGRYIIKTYRENPSNESLLTGSGVKFDEFVQYLIDPRTQEKQDFNDHWRQFSKLCLPCQVHYNYIGKFETLDRDVNGLLTILGVNDWLRFPRHDQLYKKTSQTHDKFKQFYKTIDTRSLQKLIQIFSEDAHLFGYNSTKVAESVTLMN